MKRFLPILIHSFRLGNGLWWGKRVFFKGGYILPMSLYFHELQTPEGRNIRPSWPESWHRTNDKYRDK